MRNKIPVSFNGLARTNPHQSDQY